MSLTFISGGCRSGKSAFAQNLAEKKLRQGHALFVATAHVRDAEMLRRVKEHKASRGPRWQVCEPAAGGAAVLAGLLPEAARGADVVLFDCLTLWVSSYMEDQEPVNTTGGVTTADQRLRSFSEDCGELLRTLQALPCPTVLVSNEVGMGLVPESAEGRMFRDYAGIANQLAAARADRAVFMVSGIPLPLKGQLPG